MRRWLISLLGVKKRNELKLGTVKSASLLLPGFAGGMADCPAGSSLRLAKVILSL